MPARLSLALALVLSACTSHEGPVTSSDPTPEPQRADIKVAVASVQMIQDCPDPPDAPAAPTVAPTEAPIIHPVPGYAPPPPAAPMGDVAAGSALPGTGSWSPPCTQSTVQLSLTNEGPVDGQIRITAMRLLDAASKREVGKIASRKPSQWFEPGGYRPWDERVAAGQTIKVGYRIGEPNQQPSPNDGSLNSSQTYILEIDVAVDGRTVTVRSAEFVREPIYQIVT
jgi:hypothetical protein